MIATHLGIVDEDSINNMSFLLFEDVLSELGKKLNYEAVVNYAGNSFAKDSWKMIREAYPMADDSKKNSVANFFANADIRIVAPQSGDRTG